MTIALYSPCLCIPNNRSQFNKSSIYIQTETTECDNSQIKTNKTVKKSQQQKRKSKPYKNHDKKRKRDSIVFKTISEFK